MFMPGVLGIGCVYQTFGLDITIFGLTVMSCRKLCFFLNQVAIRNQGIIHSLNTVHFYDVIVRM